MTDIIGCSHMSQGSNTFITTDRKGISNAALNLNNGFTSVPPGVYFNSAFTITAWVYVSQLVGRSPRLIDFGTGTSNNIVASLSHTAAYNFPLFHALNPYTYLFNLDGTQSLTLNRWTFLSYTFSGTVANIYMNGINIGTQTLPNGFPANVTRTTNYIGKSNWPNNGNALAIIDELRFYNRFLSVTELINLMNLI